LISTDPSLGLVCLPYGSPTYHFYGVDRRGANLFGNSLIALDALTGKLEWYFQTVHHDAWDNDLEAASVLVDIVRDGKTVPALAEVRKAKAVLHIGLPRWKAAIFGVEEWPVPPSDVPGEQNWSSVPKAAGPTYLHRLSYTGGGEAKRRPRKARKKTVDEWSLKAQTRRMTKWM
jgi:quinoprotein glucose dehydrogenase